jgi:hypothetical protein
MGRYIYCIEYILNMQRSCGSKRAENGLYLCVDSSLFGKPIEYFLIDPPQPCDLKPFRTPIIVERKKGKICDIAIYIGKEYYPFCPDYLEESRIMGISRRIPRTFPIERLTLHESRMLLIHERAIPLFKYETGRECPRKKKHTGKEGDTCVFDLWHLSSLETIKKKHDVQIIDEDHASITIPSTKYGVNIPKKPNIDLEQKKAYKYHMGIFASFWVGHLEYVNKNKKIPEEIKNKIKNTSLDIMAVKE